MGAAQSARAKKGKGEAAEGEPEFVDYYELLAVSGHAWEDIACHAPLSLTSKSSSSRSSDRIDGDAR